MPVSTEVLKIPNTPKKKALAASVVLLLSVNAGVLASSQPETKVEAVSAGSEHPTIADLGHCTLQALANIKDCVLEGLEPTTTTSTTTSTTLPRPPKPEVHPNPSKSLAYIRPPTTVSTATPPSGSDTEWIAPEGCMRPMGPTEAKTKEEAHFCWDGLLALYAWPQREAFAVMYCESKGNPYADNPTSTANGLFQVLDGSKDPRTNASEAYTKYSQRHWQPWETCPWHQYLE